MNGVLQTCLGLGVALAVTFGGFAARSEALCTSAIALIGGSSDVPSLEGETCSRVLSGDGVDQYFCAIEFTFRSDAARAKYEGLAFELQGCLGADAAVPVGPAVNHPDSYDQSVFEVDGRQVSVALKDKGALQRTYVFVRLPAN